MFGVYTGKPDDKKEKGGDKADDKVRNVIQFNSEAATYMLSISVVISISIFLFCHQNKGTFSQSHYYLALYRFKAIEKDDLDLQYVWKYLILC